MSYRENIFDLFRQTHETDKEKFIKPWMINWAYQDIRKKRKFKYEDELPEDFYQYNGPEDLVSWMNWQSAEKPDYFEESMVNELIKKSRSFDESLYNKFNLNLDIEFYDECIARNNAQDYILANFYQMQGPSTGKRILDFGAGYGRQANLWSQDSDQDLVFIGMDAIPKSYCLQHLYYSGCGNVNDYAVDRDSFALDASSKGFYHLPTWRFDLIPDNYIDKIVTVQVLPELNEKLVKYTIGQFKRILKDTGMLYIRDHMSAWRPGHSLDTDKYLVEHGFTLEFKPHIVDKVDLHGMPRIYRKTNPKVVEQEKITFRQRLQETKVALDTKTGGKVNKIINTLKGK